MKSVFQLNLNKYTIKAILFNNVEVPDEFFIVHLLINFFTGVATEIETHSLASNIEPLSNISRVDAALFPS